MTIVWGHNNFRLKSVEPAEIGLLDKSYDNYKFELRQKYGHLFWIPFIPLGKMWVVKKQGSQLYHCPADIEALLQERFPMRTSLWAWTGPLLIIAGLFIFNIVDKVGERNQRKRSEERFAVSNSSMEKEVNQLKPNDYLLFNVKQPNSGYYSYEKIPLKVLSFNGDQVKLGVIYSPYDKEKTAEKTTDITPDNKKARVVVEEATSINNYEGSTSINDESDIVRLERNYRITDSFSISKSQLAQAICKEYGKENDFQGIRIPQISVGGTCMLKDIMHIEGPILIEVHLDQVKRDGKYIELKNTGFDAIADSIVSEDPQVSWQLSKKRSLNYGEVIALKANGKAKAVLYCSNKQGQVHKYLVDNTDWRITVSRIYTN